MKRLLFRPGVTQAFAGVCRLQKTRLRSAFFYHVNNSGIFKKYNNQFQQTILFRPWFWFVLNSIIFTLSLLLIFRKRFTKIILPHAVLNSSGTLFCTVYLFIGLINSARFIYWGMVSTALSTFGIVLSIINSGFRHIWLRSD